MTKDEILEHIRLLDQLKGEEEQRKKERQKNCPSWLVDAWKVGDAAVKVECLVSYLNSEKQLKLTLTLHPGQEIEDLTERVESITGTTLDQLSVKLISKTRLFIK